MGADAPTSILKIRTLIEEEYAQELKRTALELKRAALELQSLLVEMEPYDFNVELSNVDSKTVRLDYAGPNGLICGRVDLTISNRVIGAHTGQALQKSIYKASSIDDGVLCVNADGFNPSYILFKLFNNRSHFKAFEESLMSAFLTSNIQAFDPQRLAHDLYGASISLPFSFGEGYDKVRIDNRAIFTQCDVYITAKSTVRIDLEGAQFVSHSFEGDTLYKALEQAHPFVKQAIDNHIAAVKRAIDNHKARNV